MWIDSTVEAVPGSITDWCVVDEYGGTTLIDPYFVYETLWTKEVPNPFNFQWQHFSIRLHFKYLVKVVSLLQEQLAFWEMDVHTALTEIFLTFKAYINSLQKLLDHLLE